MIIRRFSPLSVGKTLAVVYACLGLLIGGAIAAASVLGGALGPVAEASRPVLRLLFGAGAVVLLPLLYGAMGFVFGTLGAVVYNWSATFTGGIEVEVH